MFDDMLADTESNKKLSLIVTVFKRKKSQCFICFYITILSKVPKPIRLNATHHYIMKIIVKKTSTHSIKSFI